MSERTHFERAEHPTAPNGQCPICYSAGFEAAEGVLTRERDLIRKLAAALVVADGYVNTHALYGGEAKVEHELNAELLAESEAMDREKK